LTLRGNDRIPPKEIGYAARGVVGGFEANRNRLLEKRGKKGIGLRGRENIPLEGKKKMGKGGKKQTGTPSGEKMTRKEGAIGRHHEKKSTHSKRG